MEAAPTIVYNEYHEEPGFWGPILGHGTGQSTLTNSSHLAQSRQAAKFCETVFFVSFRHV